MIPGYHWYYQWYYHPVHCQGPWATPFVKELLSLRNTEADMDDFFSPFKRQKKFRNILIRLAICVCDAILLLWLSLLVPPIRIFFSPSQERCHGKPKLVMANISNLAHKLVSGYYNFRTQNVLEHLSAFLIGGTSREG